MARDDRKRIRTRDVTGWLIVDKHPGVTSADAVAIAKRVFRARKVGHAGTLDKPATGLLALAFGTATKTVQFVMNAKKTYRFSVQFGRSTTTDDATGETVATSDTYPSVLEVKNALEKFTGTIMQRPPRYSAIKIGGRRAATLAASGESPDLVERPVVVHDLTLLNGIATALAEFEMTCSKGTYVRSIARDLGEFLGCYGHVVDLRRISSGYFHVDNAIPLRQLERMEDPAAAERLLCRLEAGLAGLPRHKCSSEQARDLLNGKSIANQAAFNEPGPIWASFRGVAVAICEVADTALKPVRVFHVPSEVFHSKYDKLCSS